MRIQNATHVPTRDLELMVGFVEGLLPAAAASRLQVLQNTGGRKVSGQAEDGEPGPFPCLVTLWVAPLEARTYPAKEQYVPYLPAITVFSQEEELLLVLAHELRHCHQFLNKAEFGEKTSPFLEEDAETFAYEALFLWRQRRPDRRCRTRAA